MVLKKCISNLELQLNRIILSTNIIFFFCRVLTVVPFSSSYMNTDNSSLAAAALYDLKNEQLQLANAALQQQQGSSVESKQQEALAPTTSDQSAATTAEGQQFAEGGE